MGNKLLTKFPVKFLKLTDNKLMKYILTFKMQIFITFNAVFTRISNLKVITLLIILVNEGTDRLPIWFYLSHQINIQILFMLPNENSRMLSKI